MLKVFEMARVKDEKLKEKQKKQSVCVVCGIKYNNPKDNSDTCYDCRED
jgi:hypothetical protein